MYAQNGNTFRILHNVGLIMKGVLHNFSTKNDAGTGIEMQICETCVFSSTKDRTSNTI
jgi:hypothetical protein